MATLRRTNVGVDTFRFRSWHICHLLIRRSAGNHPLRRRRAHSAEKCAVSAGLGYEAEEGSTVTIRLAVVAAAALSCAACANQGLKEPMGLGVHGQIDTHYAQQPGSRMAKAPTTKRLGTSKTSNMKQTLGGKVLSAIALERVTGRKPDPRRFKELR